MRRTALPAFALLLVLARSGAASTAADLCPPAADPCVVSSPRVVTAGSVLDFGTRTLDIQGTGSLTVGGGHLAILAGTVRVESHGKLIGAVSQGTSGSISIVTSDDIRIDTGAAGDGVVDTSASDNPGQIDLTAHRDIVIGGRVDSNANSDPGVGGVINVTSDGNMTVTGAVRAKGGLLGLGGVVTLQAGGTASVTGQLRVDAGDGGDIYVTSMNAGITAAGALNASGGGNIGDGGSVTLLAARDVGVGGSISVWLASVPKRVAPRRCNTASTRHIGSVGAPASSSTPESWNSRTMARRRPTFPSASRTLVSTRASGGPPSHGASSSRMIFCATSSATGPRSIRS